MATLGQKMFDFIDDKFTQFGCKIWGHRPINVIEEYSREIIWGNFKGEIGKKINRCQPYKKIVIRGKMICLHCRTTYLGVIGKKINRCQPYKKIVIRGKMICLHCRTTYLGVIVKKSNDDNFTDKDRFYYR
jgi:hypothetical protein